MNSISASPSRQINSSEPNPFRLVASNGVLRDEDSAPYDGQSKAERQGGARVCVVSIDVTRTILGTLGTTAYGIYAFLDTYCNAERLAWPSETTIADGVGLSVKQVRRILHALAGAGWIEIRERTNRFGFVIGNEYYLKDHTTSSSKTGDIAGTSPGHRVVENVPRGKYKVKGEVNTQTPTLDDASSARLQAFKQAYPVKRRSANARALAQEWIPLTVAEREAAIASLAAFTGSEEWRKDDGRYIPSILRFVQERRWECVPPAETPSLNPVDYGYFGTTGWDEFKQAVRRGEIPGVTLEMIGGRV